MAFEVTPFSPKPDFDIFFYMDLSGSNRLEQDLMQQLETNWNKWAPKLKGYHLKSPDESYVLFILDKSVEQDAEAVWQGSPVDGLAMHNLAITIVMSAAQNQMPEMAEGRCAPVPEPTDEIIEALKSVGLSMTVDGTLDHKYAVFTRYPFQGGCETCFLQEKCPNSTVRT